jgi:pantothenate kinase-related protein Tda10
MTEREKLILHLQNLAKSKTKSATLDVLFLLGILNALPKEQLKPTAPRFDKIGIDVDGGGFSDATD